MAWSPGAYSERIGFVFDAEVSIHVSCVAIVDRALAHDVFLGIDATGKGNRAVVEEGHRGRGVGLVITVSIDAMIYKSYVTT